MARLKLKHIETFLTITEEGGITAAAKVLDVSKASVSHNLQQLEKALNMTLFHRTTRQMSLTSEGQVFLTQCQRIKEDLSELEELVSNTRKAPSGVLKIHCNPHFVESPFYKVINEYLYRYQDMEIDLIAEERMPDMHKEHVDIIFGIDRHAPENAVKEKLGNTRYILCASPEYLKERGTPETMADLKTHSFIELLGRDTLLTHGKKKRPPKLKARLHINHESFIRKAVLNGWGIAQIHDYMVSEQIKNGELIEILPENQAHEVPMYMFYEKTRFMQAKTRAFIEIVHEYLNSFKT